MHGFRWPPAAAQAARFDALEVPLEVPLELAWLVILQGEGYQSPLGSNCLTMFGFMGQGVTCWFLAPNPSDCSAGLGQSLHHQNKAWVFFLVGLLSAVDQVTSPFDWK